MINALFQNIGNNGLKLSDFDGFLQ
jgi:hypothetical protein